MQCIDNTTQIVTSEWPDTLPGATTSQQELNPCHPDDSSLGLFRILELLEQLELKISLSFSLTANSIDFTATKLTRPQPTWLSCVGCNASGISQTSLIAQDHTGSKKCTADNDQQLTTSQMSINYSNVWN